MCSTEYTFYSRIVFTGFKSQKVLSFCGSESSCLTEHKDSDTRPSQGTCVVLAHKRMRTTWCGVSTGDTERDWTYFNHSVNSLQPCGRQEHLSYTKTKSFLFFSVKSSNIWDTHANFQTATITRFRENNQYFHTSGKLWLTVWGSKDHTATQKLSTSLHGQTSH